MDDRLLAQLTNALKVALAFLNGFCGILAAYPGPEVPPLVRAICAATVAGCGGALLMLTPPGTKTMIAAVADEIERRLREEPAG